MNTATTGKELGLGPPWFHFLAALVCTFLESVRSFDLLAQSPFFRHGEWLISQGGHADYKWMAYIAPKVFIGIVGGTFLFLFLASFSDKCRLRLQAWRKPSLLVSCGILFVPLTVAVLKNLSGVYGPADMEPYGGRCPHVGLLEQLWAYGTTGGGRSFPAGHASGGFALMALYYLPLRGLWKRLLLVFGILVGWSMGLYQMARGEHFLSHTLVTMFLALGVLTLLDRQIDNAGRLRKVFVKKK